MQRLHMDYAKFTTKPDGLLTSHLWCAPISVSDTIFQCFEFPMLSTYDFLFRWRGRALRWDTFGAAESANVDIQTPNVSNERIAMHT